MQTPRKPETWNAEVSNYSTPAQVYSPSPSQGMPISSNSRDKNSIWNWISLLFFAVILSNSIFSTLLLCHVAFINQETRSSLLILAAKVEDLTRTNSFPANTMPQAEVNGGEVMSNLESKWIEPEAEIMDEPETNRFRSPFQNTSPLCPPCQSEEGIPMNKDPMNFINMLYQKVSYTCQTICLNPPIYIANLTIPNYNETWAGKANTKVQGKQEAAFKALTALHKTVADEAIIFVPGQYNPRCEDNLHNFILDDSTSC